MLRLLRCKNVFLKQHDQLTTAVYFNKYYYQIADNIVYRRHITWTDLEEIYRVDTYNKTFSIGSISGKHYIILYSEGHIILVDIENKSLYKKIYICDKQPVSTVDIHTRDVYLTTNLKNKPIIDEEKNKIYTGIISHWRINKNLELRHVSYKMYENDFSVMGKIYNRVRLYDWYLKSQLIEIDKKGFIYRGVNRVIYTREPADNKIDCPKASDENLLYLSLYGAIYIYCKLDGSYYKYQDELECSSEEEFIADGAEIEIRNKYNIV